MILMMMIGNFDMKSIDLAYDKEMLKMGIKKYLPLKLDTASWLVFGASGSNSYDCSGFVCAAINSSGVANVGRTSAQGLFNYCNPVMKTDAKPGDLVFFSGTYSTTNTVTHVGIYIGNGWMAHAGDPISYVSIETSYWQNHFYSFGRLSRT